MDISTTVLLPPVSIARLSVQYVSMLHIVLPPSQYLELLWLKLCLDGMILVLAIGVALVVQLLIQRYVPSASLATTWYPVAAQPTANHALEVAMIVLTPTQLYAKVAGQDSSLTQQPTLVLNVPSLVILAPLQLSPAHHVLKVMSISQAITLASRLLISPIQFNSVPISNRLPQLIQPPSLALFVFRDIHSLQLAVFHVSMDV